MPNRDVFNAKVATIRDFSGGWNIADNPFNLSSKFLPLSDNVMVGVDGSLSPRYGYKLFADLRQGVTTVYPTAAFSVSTTISTAKVRIVWAGHPFSSGEHVTFSGEIAGGVTLTGLYGVIKVDANNFDVYVRSNATSTASVAYVNRSITRDTHILAGSIIEQAFFQSYIIVFDDIGEIASIDPTTRTITRIWDVSKSAAEVGAPAGWRKQAGEVGLKAISYDVWRQGLMVVNGRSNDKPIEINFQRTAGAIVQFLVDPSAGPSNAFIYQADFIMSFNSYVVLFGSNNTSTASTNTPTTVDISRVDTNCVFEGAASKGDAVQIDLGRVTQTVEPRITAVANIRDKIFIGFHDSGMLGKLGVYSGAIHKPTFDDQIAQHGAINHRVVVNMGNDLLMCDYAGVPAFTQSMLQGVVTPERISQLVDPELNKHLGRLSQTTLQYSAFAVYNVRDRQYMLFIPKFDSSSAFTGAAVPIYVTSDLRTEGIVLVNAPNHTVSAGDYVTASGATSLTGLTAANINGLRRVRAIVNSDYFLMEVGAIPTTDGASGGGTITFTPLNDETICYAFTFNPQLKIRRWTRFRSLYFTSGVLSRDGRVYFSNNSGRIYEWGTSDKPYYADAIGDTGSTDYGDAITWVAETPWSDFGDRLATKINNNLRVDSQGSGEFAISVFTDNIYQDGATLDYQPSVSDEFTSPSARTDLVASDAGGFGLGTQLFGGGRRTREQLSYHFPFRCQIAKIRIEGSTTTKLKISGIHLTYLKGSAMR